MNIPTKEQWTKIIQRSLPGNTPKETYDEYISWIQKVNEVLPEWQQTNRMWNDFIHSLPERYRHTIPGVSYDRSNFTERILHETNCTLKTLPDLSFDWDHALLIVNRKEQLRQYERAIRIINNSITLIRKHQIQIGNIKMDTTLKANIIEHKVYYITCSQCQKSLGSTTPYGFILLEDWNDIPETLCCSHCNTKQDKPGKP